MMDYSDYVSHTSSIQIRSQNFQNIHQCSPPAPPVSAVPDTIQIKESTIEIFNFVVFKSMKGMNITELATLRPLRQLRLTSYSFFNFRHLGFAFLKAEVLTPDIRQSHRAHC